MFEISAAVTAHGDYILRVQPMNGQWPATLFTASLSTGAKKILGVLLPRKTGAHHEDRLQFALRRTRKY